MQLTTAAVQSEGGTDSFRVPLADRRNFVHKRMERWVRLQQFVYGLPDDYSYAVCVSKSQDGRFHSLSLVKVGWMCWFGTGSGADKQHSLSISLLNTTEALSANTTSVFFHKLNRILVFGLGFFRKKSKDRPIDALVKQEERELLAG
jgi:hypothetical protein